MLHDVRAAQATSTCCISTSICCNTAVRELRAAHRHHPARPVDLDDLPALYRRGRSIR
jgi:hypothetical protein